MKKIKEEEGMIDTFFAEKEVKNNNFNNYPEK